MTRQGDGRSAGEDSTPTVVEQAERHPAAARELAAARLALNIGWALNEAVRVRGWQAKRLAAELGVGESAVSQVLNGDGNLRVSTIARYARALGYQARLVLEPVAPGLGRISEPPPRRRPHRLRVEPSRRVVLPESGWHVVSASDGAVWGVQTTLAERAEARVVLRSECTLLTPRRSDWSAVPVTAATVGDRS